LIIIVKITTLIAAINTLIYKHHFTSLCLKVTRFAAKS
jgi:hypothetical protein